MVIQAALDVAVQVQELELTVMLTLSLPPEMGRVLLMGLILLVHGPS